MRAQSTLLFVLLFPFAHFSSPRSEIPAKFLGLWTIAHSEGFDEYLEAKGYGWFLRQVVKLASITKIFSANADGTYSCKVQTGRKNLEWKNFRLDKEFQAEYLDDLQHKITFSYDGAADQLVETHTKVDSDSPPDVYKYDLDAEGFLVMHMEYNGVKTKRFYKKNAPK